MRDRLITVLGGSGFIGRHLVRRLAAQGHRIRIGVRRPEKARFLQPLGDVGQVVPVQVNVRDDTSVLAAINGAWGVVNLVGVLHSGGPQTFAALHAQGARRVAHLARLGGVARLIQVSAIGAARDSASQYAQTKAEGEEAALAEFPAATVVRPSLVFGPEDQLFNRFAALAALSPVLPLFGETIAEAGLTRFQPVYVGDVAAAIVRCLAEDGAAGKIYELGGPKIYTYRQLMALVLAYTGRRRLLVPVPFGFAHVGAAILELLPGAPLTRDQVRLLRQDSICGALPGLAQLGVEPTPVEAVVPGFLSRFRKGGRVVEV
ncbi:MAG: complex I NDUFA9 subunit family protein [Proteobacteria bacterium]|nr:complex I NDUFA9 subunit family protein [Pseudomonadota bacterium]